MEAEGQAGPGPTIGNASDLDLFSRLPPEERSLTEPLRGVLAEVALTGRIRYKWPQLRPLLEYVLEQVLLAYDAETHVEVGPPGPDNVANTIFRFKSTLSKFTDAPWTLQRLCEVLLEPKKQYNRLPKLVLAIEKCLLVTSELPPMPAEDLPPPPLLSSLGPVNVNPPSLYQSSHQHHGGHSGGPEDSSAFTNSIIEVRHHPHVGNHTGTPEHIEEDHWPEGKGPFRPAPLHRPPGHSSPTPHVGATPVVSNSGGVSTSGSPLAATDHAGALHAVGDAPSHAAHVVPSHSSPGDARVGAEHGPSDDAGASGSPGAGSSGSALGRRKREPEAPGVAASAIPFGYARDEAADGQRLRVPAAEDATQQHSGSTSSSRGDCGAGPMDHDARPEPAGQQQQLGAHGDGQALDQASSLCDRRHDAQPPSGGDSLQSGVGDVQMADAVGADANGGPAAGTQSLGIGAAASGQDLGSHKPPGLS